MGTTRLVALGAGFVAHEPVAAAFLATWGTEELALHVPDLWVLGLLQLWGFKMILKAKQLAKQSVSKKPSVSKMIPSPPDKHLGLLKCRCQIHTPRSLSAHCLGSASCLLADMTAWCFAISFLLHSEQLFLAQWDKSRFWGMPQTSGLRLRPRRFS